MEKMPMSTANPLESAPRTGWKPPDAVLREATVRFGITPDTLRFISATTNCVYAWPCPDGAWRILRISRRPETGLASMQAEMDWMGWLARNGILVPEPVPDAEGRTVSAFHAAGHCWLLAAFTAVPGVDWNRDDPSLWNESIWLAWGRLVGDMHRLAKERARNGTPLARPDFDGTHHGLERLAACPEADRLLADWRAKMADLPRDGESWGILHYDVHPWNFRIHQGRLWLFDFDDTLHGWFALDIGVALYHGLWWGRRRTDGEDVAGPLVRRFMEGYCQANRLDAFWTGQIPFFMTYRQLCKFSWFFRPEADAHQEERLANLLAGRLFTGFDLDPGWLG